MKKTIKTIALAALCFLFSIRVPAQVIPLKVGDKVADLTINNIINYKSSTAKLSDFKGKLLILDFWATWCGACIQSFPKMEKLQQEFADQLQVLMVTSETREKATAFFANRKNADGKPFTLPGVTGDEKLKALFPHRLLPHYVWIADGVVKAITGSFELSSKTIEDMLGGEATATTKTDISLDRPLYLSDQAPAGLQHYSILLRGYNESLGGNTRFRETDGSRHGWLSTNTTMLWLYRQIASRLYADKGEKFYNNRLIIETGDSSRLYYSRERLADAEWRKSNFYSYELVVPVRDSANLYRFALEDLNRYSDYTASIEKRRVNCLILVRNQTKLLQSAGGNPSTTMRGDSLKLVNTTMYSLILRLNSDYGLGIPVLDRTGYKGQLDMSIKAEWKDLKLLNAELSRYGLELLEAEEDLDMLVLRDKLNLPAGLLKPKKTGE